MTPPQNLSQTGGGTGQTTAQSAFDALCPTTSRGDITVRGAATNDRLGGNATTTKKFLSQYGNGSVPTTTAWDALSSTDIPNLDASKITSGTLPTARGGLGATSFSNTRVPYYNGSNFVDSADMTYGSAILALGASGGNGAIRSYQIPGYWVELKTDGAAGKSGISRSNTDFFIYYDTNTGQTVLDATYSGSPEILFKILGTEKARISSSGLTIGSLRVRGYTTSAFPPSTTQLPSDKDSCIHYDSFDHVAYCAVNIGGTVYGVQLPVI